MIKQKTLHNLFLPDVNFRVIFAIYSIILTIIVNSPHSGVKNGKRASQLSK
jgi:hypothetical protein